MPRPELVEGDLVRLNRTVIDCFWYSTLGFVPKGVTGRVAGREHRRVLVKFTGFSAMTFQRSDLDLVLPLKRKDP